MRQFLFAVALCASLAACDNKSATTSTSPARKRWSVGLPGEVAPPATDKLVNRRHAFSLLRPREKSAHNRTEVVGRKYGIPEPTQPDLVSQTMHHVMTPSIPSPSAAHKFASAWVRSPSSSWTVAPGMSASISVFHVTPVPAGIRRPMMTFSFKPRR